MKTSEELPLPQMATIEGSDGRSVSEMFDAIVRNVDSVIHGNSLSVRHAVTCLVAGGHLLIEDVPGVGKTSLGKALAASIDSRQRRIQFTSDLLPSDVTGVRVFDRDTTKFEFRPGPIFANIVLGDEINRTPPKTQSALLEAMEERQVTVEGTTYPLPEPFMVIATQNPQEHDGTYPLPISQLDRFLMRVHLGYPDPAEEVRLTRTSRAPAPGRDPEGRCDDDRSGSTRLLFACFAALPGRPRQREQVSSGDLARYVPPGNAFPPTCLPCLGTAARPGFRPARRHKGARVARHRAPHGAAERSLRLKRPDRRRSGRDPLEGARARLELLEDLRATGIAAC